MTTAQTLIRSVAQRFAGTVIRLLVGALSLGTTTLWAQEMPPMAPPAFHVTPSLVPAVPPAVPAPTLAPAAERLLPVAAPAPVYSVATRGFFRRRGPRGARMGGGGSGGLGADLTPTFAPVEAPARGLLAPTARVLRGVLSLVRLPAHEPSPYGRPMLVYSKPAARTSVGR
ncbi:MAG: hypothetical protein LCH84_04310 [Gemmatimonadetes bacterium]|nr:hypothetical protein [Gemmatimonadota bacterium]